MNIWLIIAIIYVFMCFACIVALFVHQSLMVKTYGITFYPKISTKETIEAICLMLIFPPTLIYLIVKIIRRFYYLKRPKPLKRKELKIARADSVFDYVEHVIPLEEFNRIRGTKYTLDQVYGRGYESSITGK